jgi:hypothetical protein
MQRYGFLSSEKEGRRTFYCVTEPHLVDMMTCIEKRFSDN